jgi:transposase
VQLCQQDANPSEVFLICRSTQRQAKENAMHARFSTRIETALMRLAGRIERSKKPIDREQVERQVGRLLQRNSRASKRYQIVFEAATDTPAGLRLRWAVDPKWEDWAAHSEGVYVLQTNILDWTPEALWKTYIQLTQAESAFRVQKSELEVRPIWHQMEERVQAHILFSFLAYAMWKTLEQWMARSGLGNGPRTVLEEFARIKASTVILPTSTGRNLSLVCVTTPDEALIILLGRMGLVLPRRLGEPRWMDVVQPKM